MNTTPSLKQPTIAKRCEISRSFVLVITWLVVGAVGRADKEQFETPHLGRNLGVWRLTNDPTVRDHANYHNTQCFSPDGRYVCYTHWAGRGGKGEATIHIVDLEAGEERLVDRGVFPRWAKQHNWLFYVAYRPRAESAAKNGSCVMWLDLENNRHTMLVDGPEALGETDFADRWIYGALRFRGRTPEYEEVRIPIREEAVAEKMPEVIGAQRLPNPRYPVFFTRRDHRDAPFQATRYWYDLDGTHRRIAVPTIQQCHMCWLGNGEYMLLGNGLIRGRRWNEPFPSNIHVLAAVSVGDVSPCGTSGRYACGDSMVADLRSGDGFKYIEPLSIICFPKSIGDASGIYDADPKGSPDGTKICFVSNYDLRTSPVTRITRDVPRNADRIEVESTEGFPDSGCINVMREVIAYETKTPTSFDGIRRQAYDTAWVNLRAGRTVTSFDARCLQDEQWERTTPSAAMTKTIKDVQSPLLRQRQTDVYVAVVRRPDQPFLRLSEDRLEIIPGENHAEIRGYRVLFDRRPVSSELLSPGEKLSATQTGEYRAVAVEWSGLESEPSAPVTITTPETATTIQALKDVPEDFQWTESRWADAAHRVKETWHRYEGLIRRDIFENSQLVRREDLNRQGKAIRTVYFSDERVTAREYTTSSGTLVSRELFDADGYITESIRYTDDGIEREHWWFDRGWPIRQVYGGREYVRRGDRFGRLINGRFIDLPRGALSE